MLPDFMYGLLNSYLKERNNLPVLFFFSSSSNCDFASLSILLVRLPIIWFWECMLSSPLMFLSVMDWMVLSCFRIISKSSALTSLNLSSFLMILATSMAFSLSSVNVSFCRFVTAVCDNVSCGNKINIIIRAF